MKDLIGELQKKFRTASNDLDGVKGQLSNANQELAVQGQELRETRQALSEAKRGASNAKSRNADDEASDAAGEVNKYRARAHIAYGVIGLLLAICAGGGYIGYQVLTDPVAPLGAGVAPVRSVATASAPLTPMKTVGLGKLPKRIVHPSPRKQVIARPSDESEGDPTAEQQSGGENAN